MMYCRVAVTLVVAMLMGGALTACGGGSEGGPGVTTTSGATGATATLAWDPVNDPSVQGYNVYYGTQSRSYSGSVNAGDSTMQAVANLDSATTYYFAVTAYNHGGQESAYSGEVSTTTP